MLRLLRLCFGSLLRLVYSRGDLLLENLALRLQLRLAQCTRESFDVSKRGSSESGFCLACNKALAACRARSPRRHRRTGLRNRRMIGVLRHERKRRAHLGCGLLSSSKISFETEVVYDRAQNRC